MTKKQKYQSKCHSCGEDVFCKACGAPVFEATPFSLWLREQPEIDSRLGYVTTNIDYMWMNYKDDGRWMLIEEKRYNGNTTYSQHKQFEIIHNACRSDKKYRGIHLLVFEKTTPDDGKIFLDRIEISKEQLISFLKFTE